jgi:hypothetical protein
MSLSLHRFILPAKKHWGADAHHLPWLAYVRR